jgi:hypothetical protein
MSPDEVAAAPFTPVEAELAAAAMSTHIIGDVATVVEGLGALQRRTNADELMLSTRVHALEARHTSLSLIANGWGMEQRFD